MIRSEILALSPYKPPLEGRSSGSYLLLDFNERTMPPSPAVMEALMHELNRGRIQQYPEYGDLAARIADYAGVREENLLVTNGSDQGIDLVFRLVAEQGDEAIIPAPTFAMLTHLAHAARMRVIEPCYTLEGGFSPKAPKARSGGYPLDQVLAAVSPRTKVICVCSPNNPTGTLLESERIIDLARQVPQAAILVDECYFEYSGETVVGFVDEVPNLFVTRTFSKTWGLAALRIGYVVSGKSNIENLLKIRGPYDVNRLAVAAVAAALADPSYVQSYVREVRERSMPLLARFFNSRGIAYWPSAANFYLFYPPDAKRLEADLRTAGILVRPRSGPGIDGTVRVNVGTEDETKRLITVLERVL